MESKYKIATITITLLLCRMALADYSTNYWPACAHPRRGASRCIDFEYSLDERERAVNQALSCAPYDGTLSSIRTPTLLSLGELFRQQKADLDIVEHYINHQGQGTNWLTYINSNWALPTNYTEAAALALYSLLTNYQTYTPARSFCIARTNASTQAGFDTSDYGWTGATQMIDACQYVGRTADNLSGALTNVVYFTSYQATSNGVTSGDPATIWTALQSVYSNNPVTSVFTGTYNQAVGAISKSWHKLNVPPIQTNYSIVGTVRVMGQKTSSTTLCTSSTYNASFYMRPTEYGTWDAQGSGYSNGVAILSGTVSSITGVTVITNTSYYGVTNKPINMPTNPSPPTAFGSQNAITTQKGWQQDGSGAAGFAILDPTFTYTNEGD